MTAQDKDLSHFIADEESLVHYADFLDTLNIGVIAHAPPDGRIAYANRSAATIIGQEQLLDRVPHSQTQVVDGDGLPLAVDDLPAMRVLADGQPVINRLLGFVRNDERRWARVSALPVVAGDGSLLRVVVTFTDITAVRVAAAVIAASEERLRTILSRAPFAICITDEAGVFVGANEAYCHFTGYAREELIGRHFTLTIPPEQRAEVSQKHDQFIADGRDSRREWQVQTRDGALRTVLADGARIEDDAGRAQRVTFLVDISERKLLEEALAQKNRLLGEQAERDSLTYLYNHRRIRDLCEHELARSARYGHALSLAIVDLDRFKEVNDTYGHLVGDEVLVSVAATLRDGVRATDRVGRHGGEEFLIVMPETDAAAARLLVDRLRRQTEQLRFAATGLRISFSAGIAECAAGESAIDTLRRADAALYAAKNGERGCSETAEHPAPS